MGNQTDTYTWETKKYNKRLLKKGAKNSLNRNRPNDQKRHVVVLSDASFCGFWCWHDNFVVHYVNKVPKSFLSIQVCRYLYKIFSLCFVHITKSRRKLENDKLLNLFAWNSWRYQPKLSTEYTSRILEPNLDVLLPILPWKICQNCNNII